MNKKIVIISTLGLVLFIGAAYAYPGDKGYQQSNFVDEDNDGICDHAGEGYGRGFVDEDNDGICDHYQHGNCYGCGNGFVDEDNDGICDHAGEGYGHGHGHGHGKGRGWSKGG